MSNNHSDENIEPGAQDVLDLAVAGDWTAEEIELLIEKVKERPLLYNLKHAEYKNAGKKELAWMAVSQILNKTGNYQL